MVSEPDIEQCARVEVVSPKGGRHEAHWAPKGMDLVGSHLNWRKDVGP